MPKGIKYVSLCGPSGYGLSGVAYVRALLGAGLPLWWSPQVFAPMGLVGWTPWCTPASNDLLRIAGDDAVLSDLPAMLRATCRPVEHDVQIVHLVPEYWPYVMEPGRLRVGYTMWEADRLPANWPQLLNLADRILVPDQRTRDLFVAAGLRPSVHVVPHVRRHVWNSFSPQEIREARTRLRIPDGHYVFYSINTWEPRKAVPDLLRAYIETFDAADPVVLLLKVPDTAVVHPDSHDRLPVAQVLEQTVLAIQRATGRSSLPQIRLVAAKDVSGRQIDLIHQLGDCFISLSRGECWGLGAFDAATLGKPVIMTGWGGQVDFLGQDYPGLVDYQLQPVEPWVAYATFSSDQRWAHCDLVHAGRLMRWAFTERAQAAEVARRLRSRILTRYGEPVVARTLLEAIG